MSDDQHAWGGHVLLEVVGTGLHSTVHRARDGARAGRIVVVKHLHLDVPPEALARLQQQSRTLESLGHPGIAPLLDVVRGPDERIGLVLAHAAGGSLEDVLERQGPLPWPQVADLGVRLASALAAAHEVGVVHGGVRPTNVLLGTEDAPRLADFGLAALREAVHPDEVVPPAAAHFVAPEVAAGAPRSPRSDVHGLGMVLDRARVHDDGAPAALVDAIARATASDPADRFRSARQLHEALAPVLARDDTTQPFAVAARPSHPGARGTQALGAREVPPTPGRSQTAPTPWVLVVGAILAVVVVAGLWAVGSGDEVADRGDPAATPASSTATPMDELPPREPGPACAGVEAPADEGEVLLADVDGRGCTLPVVVTEEVVDGDPTIVLMLPAAAGDAAGRYALGEAGHHVVVGDWDCDGTDTPGLVRPDDGEVFLFDGYGELAPTRAPELAAGADPRVVTDEDDCDHVTG